MEPNRGRSNPTKNPRLVQVNRVPSRPPLPLPARARAATAQGGSRAWGESSSAPRRASPACAVVSESLQSWGQSSNPPRRPTPAYSMVSESTQLNPNLGSIRNMNSANPNPGNVGGGQHAIPVAFPVEYQASNLHSLVFRPPGIPTTYRPRYVWSPVTGYRLYWQPALGLQQAQRRAPTGAVRGAPTHAPTLAYSHVPVEYGFGTESINSVDHLAFEQRSHTQGMGNGLNTEPPLMYCPTMDATNPWGSPDNEDDE